MQSKGWLNAAVVYGYFPCVSEGNDLIILNHEGSSKGEERLRFSFPRQSRDRRLCLADFFKSKDSGETDVVSFQVITMGQSISDAITKLFQANLYREYLELHGLSVQLTESLYGQVTLPFFQQSLNMLKIGKMLKKILFKVMCAQ